MYLKEGKIKLRILLKYLALILMFGGIVLLSNAQSKNPTMASFLGKNWDEVKVKLDKKKNRYFYSFEFDDSVKIYYLPKEIDNEYKFHNFFTFKNLVFRIVQVTENKKEEDKIYFERNYIDTIIQKSFESYFIRKYKIQPLYDSIPTSFYKYITERRFGLFCGSGPFPTALGTRYLDSKNLSYSSKDIENLILSFSEGNRILGLILFDPQKHKECTATFERFADSDLKYSICYGCEPVPPVTFKKMLEMMPMLKKH